MFKLFWVWEEQNETNELDIEINKTIESSEDIWQIALDILETDYDIFIVAPIAWVDLSDINITLNKSVLTIEWEREKPNSIYNRDFILRNSECFWWKFIRNVILPENLDFDKIKATMDNNLLVITIPKLKFNNYNIKINRVEW